MPSQRMPGTPRLSPLRCRSVTAEWRPQRGAHAELVVGDHEHHRQLPQRREVERLAERALVGGAVAERAQRDLVGALVVARQRDAGGDRQVAADDPVAAHEAAREVEHVHRAAAPARAAVDAPEQLGHHVLGRRAAHERVAVRAVGGDQVVAPRAAPARCPRSSPPRRSTGAGSRRPSRARTSRPRAPRSGGSASSCSSHSRASPGSGRRGSGELGAGAAGISAPRYSSAR